MPSIPTNTANEKKFRRVDSYSTEKFSKKKPDPQKRLGPREIRNKHNDIIGLLFDNEDEHNEDTHDEDEHDEDEQSEIIEKIFNYGSKVLSAQGSGRRNILHMVIEDCPLKYAHNAPTHLRNFLQRLIIEHPEVLNQRDDVGQTPLDKAARKGKPTFFLLMDHIVPDETIKELKKGDWREGKRDPETTKHLEQIAECFQRRETGNLNKATSDAHGPRSLGDTNTRTIDAKTTDQDVDNIQSLNMQASDFDNCRRGSFHHSELRSKAQAPLDDESLDQWMRTLNSCLESALSVADDKADKTSCLHMLLGDENSFAVSSKASRDASRLISNFERLISICPKSILKTLDSQDGFTPLHHAVRLYQHDQIDYESINEIIRQLVEAAPDTIYSVCEKRGDRDALTPYRLLKKTWDNRGNRTERSNPYWYNELEKFLKSAVIGDRRSRDEKIEHLYGGPKEAKRLFFDIPRVNEKVNREYIEDLDQRVSFDFEAALEYVCLPEHDAEESNSLHDSQHRSRSNRIESLPEQQCDPYEGIFDWLAEDKEVEKIFKIVVDDMGPNPHSDDGIRNALTIPIGPKLKQDDKRLQSDRSNSLPQSRFNIEVWDWRRLDICSETIAAAAPDVRELYLYSSGNPAVFRGWGCKYGLATLKKLQLVKIKVFSRKTNDNACAEAFENFRRKFCRRCDINEDNVRIEYANHSTAGQQWDKDLNQPGSDEHIDPAWFQKLAPFTEFLQDKYDSEFEDKSQDKPTVKIALIDNGVNSAHPDLENIKGGVSFYAENNEKIPFRDFFTGPSEHGTKMAMCLRKVCPMAQLYVARLDDSMPGTEKFTVQSAVKSVRWATSMGVDIISMSWSFHKDDAPSEKQLNDFKEAIIEAKRQKILLFGSMTDVQQKPNLEDYFPLSLNDVITIGSADPWSGKPNSGAGRTSNYLFPGQNITLQNTKGNSINVSGSSLATAFAAGLSGLVLFTLQMHYHLNAETVEENDRVRLINIVKTNEGMSKIFDVLGEHPAGAEKDLYVGLGKIFPQDKGKFEDYRSMLQALITQICQRLL